MAVRPPLAGATAAEFTMRRFGRPVRIVERAVTATTAVTEIIGNNPRRLFWLINNVSTSDLWFGFSTDIAVGNAFVIGANGGFASATVEEDGESVAWSVYGVTTAASAKLRILEVVAL